MKAEAIIVAACLVTNSFVGRQVLAQEDVANKSAVGGEQTATSQKTHPAEEAATSKVAQISAWIGGGVAFWGWTREGGGLFIGVSPLMLEVEFEWDGVALSLGGHFVWAGGGEIDIGFHPGLAKEWKYASGSFSLGVAAAIAIEHDGGWHVGLGGGPTFELVIGHYVVGLDAFILGVSPGHDSPNWRPGWETTLAFGYKF